MHSLIPLSLFLTVLDVAHAIRVPFNVHTGTTPARKLGRRAPVPINNIGNAEYISNITLAGVQVSVILDTGSSDLWVKFPGTAPSTNSTGKSLSLAYAVGSASGNIQTAPLQFANFTVPDQAFLQVSDSSSFSPNAAFNGLVGLGPNQGSQIYKKLDSDAGGESMLNRIFAQDKLSENYMTFLLDRKNDPSDTLTGQFTIAEPVPGFENITSQPKLNVETVYKILKDQQHWQALTDKNHLVGPDGNIIDIESIVPKAPDGQLVAVFDSGFTFSQVPRSVSDAIYGRVQGAVYDEKNQWWTVPCGQMLNVTFYFGGVAFPIHPLDVVDDNFSITNANGSHVCIGAFQPITSAFSLFGNFDLILGMSFLRNAYTLMDFGDWAVGSDKDQGDPYVQLLPLTTDLATAHADFVKIRLAGTDTSNSSQYALLPTSEQQHSPISAAEKKAKYEEMILSRWPYIFVGCLVFVGLVVGYIVWRCCCRKRRERNANKNKGFFEQKSQTYLPLQVQGQQSQVQVNTPGFQEQHYPQQQPHYPQQEHYPQQQQQGAYGY
ncbi:aspartic peptidase A1 [Roridomyces roridus]|uniref:Aspartic peptidase A1 n=1 Tax=Roridomyces roridus TaxID=1738132 RepID=A0AAD7CB89_9AGAR|nr:aspartic peptidase A1 [Roridomyces roridus]